MPWARVDLPAIRRRASRTARGGIEEEEKAFKANKERF
jgi:hypothetical protein